MMYVCHIACAFRWEVTIVGEVVGKYFQVHRGMKLVQELSFEKGWIVAYSCIM